MKNKIFIISAIFLGFVVQSCNSADPRNLDLQITLQMPLQTENILEKKVEFKGVHFTYNSQVFREVKTEEKAEQPLELETDKPDSVAPQHLLFTLKTQNQREAIIVVYPIEEYRRIWRQVEKNNTIYFDENLKNVKKFIANKKFRVNGEIPYLPHYGGGYQTFEARVKAFSFPNGKGVFFLTHRVQERAIVNNGHLEYDFQGITEDGKYYVLAQFSPKVSFLPDNYHVGKFEDYVMPDYVNWSKSDRKKYDEYIAKITKRLENLPSDKFEPNLNYFEEIISSLKIEK